MLFLRCLSLFVRLLLRSLPGVFQYRHQLVFSWLLLMQIIAPGRNTLKQLARYTPFHIAEWHILLNGIFVACFLQATGVFDYYSDGSLRRPSSVFRRPQMASFMSSATVVIGASEAKSTLRPRRANRTNMSTSSALSSLC